MRPRDESFEPAFHELYPRSCELALEVVGDAGTADRVAREALARAFADWARLRDHPYLAGWVLRETVDVALETAARQPGVVVDGERDRKRLVGALSSLPQGQREAIVLRYLGGLSDSEVALAMNLPSPTVEDDIRDGLAVLRRLVGDDVEEAHLAVRGQ